MTVALVPTVTASEQAVAAIPAQPARQPAGISAASSAPRQHVHSSAPQRRGHPSVPLRHAYRQRLARADRNRLLARKIVRRHGGGPRQYRCLDRLWTSESGWNHRAHNPDSGAYGIPQALPGDKMARSGDDWRTNPRTQIRWGLLYIDIRYGTPCRAWAYFRDNGWY
ncbi:hypothetical protein SAMN04489712_105314 [Thermomonospora echinospora]|uniref:Transglycosylase SLT domain-containing protein n=1 Tax=Thermomonospora echinospora TaxID=1992 RepID=A0A1H6AC50_9ACTN|nr:hypothetical protein [Thermomonospora echinospora]SEG45627.1 hypothetical protein SAMN04489712_105314 [Thermomonospora echinospora]